MKHGFEREIIFRFQILDQFYLQEGKGKDRESGIVLKVVVRIRKLNLPFPRKHFGKYLRFHWRQ